ncbi:MAG: hypothetical protein CFE45_08550 [Burkholderiales bacterium PBB5]|nr:MAG: hypothetical protein CFE45_08550 [Burkholderiales bacterium PBB5]
MTSSLPQRRVFLIRVAAGSAVLGASTALQAQTKVDEADEGSVALGYRHDTTKVDGKKYPQHQASQHCANCSFWQGAASDAWAGCSMFGRKQVAANGWCLAWRKPG